MATTARPFGVQFSEAITYLKGKLPEASLAWDDLAGPVHSKVFTVAGSTSADLSRDIQDALGKALAEGGTISGFRKDFDRIVQDRGWTYNGKRGWRTSVIFNTNMRSAHMAGRWAQIQAAKADRPYLQYRTAGDARVRPQHRQWNGLIYPVDDAFWQTHYPPNGWGCRCTVRSYSLGDLRARNLQVAEPFRQVTRDVGTATGPITDRVPVGIDPGWDHNVGQSWISPELSLGQKLARLPRELQGTVTDKTISPAFQTVIEGNWKAFQTAAKAGEKTAADAQILGFLDSAVLDGLAATVPELALESTAIASKAIDATTWPQSMVDSLPQSLRAYEAVIWDAQARALLIIPAGGMPGAAAAIVPTVTLIPNTATKFDAALTLKSAGQATRASLADPTRYRTLVGRLR